MLEYIEDVDDKLFKEYSNGKNCNSFINGFHCATNEDKEKVVKKLKDIEIILFIITLKWIKIVNTHLN